MTIGRCTYSCFIKGTLARISQAKTINRSKVSSMNQLAIMQISPLNSPHVILQIITQLQILQAETNTIWKYCNATIADLKQQTHKCHRQRQLWRAAEQDLLDEKDTLQHKFLSALEKTMELESFLQQQKDHTASISHETKHLRETLQKIQNQLQSTLEELEKHKGIANNKEEEARKANKYVQEIVQELNIHKEQIGVCDTLADIAIQGEGNENSTKTIAANNIALKFLPAVDAINKLKNLKNEIEITSNKLDAVVNERDQLKVVLQERENALSILRDEKTQMSTEINTMHNQITSLTEEKQELQQQLQEEKAKSSSFQKELAEKKTNSGIFMELQNVVKGRTLNEALLDAATRGNVREIEVLLNAGANIEATDDKQRTTLILAAMKGHIEACKLLLNRGANLEAKATGWYNNTPFLAAVIYSENLDAVKFLADAGANMYAKDSLNTNAFQKDAINQSIRNWLATRNPH